MGPDPRVTAFGFGRRACPGRSVAGASLFASVATALATVNVVRAKDAQGQEIMPEVAQTSGFISHPNPFQYALEHRSEKCRVLLANDLEHAK
jgi:cytochrome P450